MIKLFSMFVRYAQLPEKEFAKLSAAQIFKLAELAQTQKARHLSIIANEESLSIKNKGQQIVVEVLPNNRQLLYTSTFSNARRFNYLGSRWVGEKEEELDDIFQKQIKQVIKN